MDKDKNVLKNFHLHDFKNRITVVSNNLFRLSEAELIKNPIEKAKNSPNYYDIESVYLLEFLLTNFDYIPEIIENIKQIHSHDDNSLRKLGFISNLKNNNEEIDYIHKEKKEEDEDPKQIFYIVYKKEFEVLVKVNDFPWGCLECERLIKFRIIKDLVETHDVLRKNSRKIGIIHPDLIFHNPITGKFHYIDTCLEAISKKADLVKNFHLINYLGIFVDYEDINDMNEKFNQSISSNNLNEGFKKDNEAASNMLYFKTDIYSILALIAYYFQDSDKIFTTFETILFSMQNDLSLNNNDFENLSKLVASWFLKYIIKNVLPKLKLNNLNEAFEFKKFIDDMYNMYFSQGYCSQCLYENKKIDDFNNNNKCELDTKTLKLLCNTHMNEDSQQTKRTDINLEKFKMKQKNLSQLSKSIEQFEEKKLIEIYNSTIKEVSKNIDIQQNSLQLFIEHKEHKLNDFINYIDYHLQKKDEQLKSEIFKEIEAFENNYVEIYKPDTDITNQLRKFNDKIMEYADFLNLSLDIKNMICYNNDIVSSYNKIRNISQEFVSQILPDHEALLIKKLETFQSEIYQLYMDEYLQSKKGIGNIFEELTTSDIRTKEHSFFSHLTKNKTNDSEYIKFKFV